MLLGDINLTASILFMVPGKESIYLFPNKMYNQNLLNFFSALKLQEKDKILSVSSFTNLAFFVEALPVLKSEHISSLAIVNFFQIFQ